MNKTAYHATREPIAITTSGFVRPARLPNVYLFSDHNDAVVFAKEFGYEDVVTVTYDSSSVERTWKPSYCKAGQVIKLKKKRTAWIEP